MNSFIKKKKKEKKKLHDTQREGKKHAAACEGSDSLELSQHLLYCCLKAGREEVEGKNRGRTGKNTKNNNNNNSEAE